MSESGEKLGGWLQHEIIDYFNRRWVRDEGWRVDALGSYPEATRVSNIYTREIFEIGLTMTSADPIPGLDDFDTVITASRLK
jgi:hypothetical protein